MRATAREWRRPGPWPSLEMDTQRDQYAEDDRKRRSTWSEKRSKRDGEIRTNKPLENVRDLVAGRGRKGGGKRTRDNGRCRHATRGSETSGRGWQGVGFDNFQMDSVRNERGVVETMTKGY